MLETSEEGRSLLPSILGRILAYLKAPNGSRHRTLVLGNLLQRAMKLRGQGMDPASSPGLYRSPFVFVKASLLAGKICGAGHQGQVAVEEEMSESGPERLWDSCLLFPALPLPALLWGHRVIEKEMPLAQVYI